MRQIIFPNTGNESGFITLRAAANERVVIDGSNTSSNTDLIYVGQHHIRISGLTIRNSSRNGIAIWGPGSRVHHVEIIGNTIHACDLGAVYAGCRSLDDPVRDLLYEGNTIRNVSLRNKRERMNSWSFGMGAGLSKRVFIRGNTVAMSHGESIGLYLSDESRIEQNTVSDGYSVNIYLDNTTNTVVTRNLVFNTGKRTFNRFGQPPIGISIANEKYPGRSNPSRANVITNNVLIDNYYAIYYGSYQRGGGLRDTLIAHNTAYGSSGPLLHLDKDGHENSLIANNIFVQNRPVRITDLDRHAVGIEFRSNLWFGGQPDEIARNSGDVMADPKLTNPGSHLAQDYRPRHDSPVRVGGELLEGVGFDFEGQRRRRLVLGAIH